MTTYHTFKKQHYNGGQNTCAGQKCFLHFKVSPKIDVCVCLISDPNAETPPLWKKTSQSGFWVCNEEREKRWHMELKSVPDSHLDCDVHQLTVGLVTHNNVQTLRPHTSPYLAVKQDHQQCATANSAWERCSQTFVRSPFKHLSNMRHCFPSSKHLFFSRIKVQYIFPSIKTSKLFNWIYISLWARQATLNIFSFLVFFPESDKLWGFWFESNEIAN